MSMKQRKQPRNENEIHKFWNFAENKAANTADLLIYGNISEYSWYGDEVTPKIFNDELKGIGDVNEINVHINSGGGDVFAAMAIYTRLKEHKANITVKIDGWAASAATIIAMAGDTIEVPASGVFMIHDPSLSVLGYYTADDFIRMAGELETVKQSIVNCYMTVTDKTEDEIKLLMSEETWYTGEEAVKAGFCTDVMFEEVETEIEDRGKVIINSVPINIDCYKSVPDRFINIKDKYNNKKHEARRKENKEMTLEEFKSDYPDIANAYKNEILTASNKDAVEKERERIKSIDEITLSGFEELADKAKYVEPVSAETFAMQIVAAQKKAGQVFLADRNDDVEESGVKNVNPISNDGYTTEDEDPFGKIIDAKYPEKK